MADKNENKRLQELGGSGYEVADGQPNIKGWDVKLSSGQKVGEVDELIFDEAAMKVRYLILDVDSDDDLDLESRDVLIPIGLARLDDNDDDVILTGVTVDQLRSLPEYDEDDLNSDLEYKIRNIFTGAGATTMSATSGIDTDTDTDTDSDFYNHENYSDENLFSNRMQNLGDSSSSYNERTAERTYPNEGSTDRTSYDTEDTTRSTSYQGEGTDRKSIPVVEENVEIGKREVQRGGVRLRSRIVQNEVSENINLREEKVNVERTPVDRPATEADIREDVIEATEKAEVPVVNKESRVVEEVSLNKEVNERQETVRDTVRKTEVDVEELDKKDNDFFDKDRS